jgi:hypothetical protein
LEAEMGFTESEAAFWALMEKMKSETGKKDGRRRC